MRCASSRSSPARMFSAWKLEMSQAFLPWVVRRERFRERVERCAEEV